MLVVEKNLHITWIKEKDSITNLKESEKFSPYSIVESLQPQLNMVRQKGPNLNNLPTWFHKGNGDGTWLLGGVWMDVYPPHLWCYNFSRFLRLNSSGSNKKSVGEKIQICGFFGLTKMSPPNMEGTSSKKETQQMDVFEESKLRSKISYILLGTLLKIPQWPT